MIKRIIYLIGKKRAKKIVKEILPLLEDCSKIIDIGAGTCNVSEALIQKGKKVVPLDIKNISYVSSIKPLIYDGEKIPFKDNSFDAALLICVLHHTNKHKVLLKEAQRVAKKVIVIEHICKNKIQELINKLLDTLLVLDFSNPHSVRTHSEWQEFFNKLSFKIKEIKFYRSFFFFNHIVYELLPRPKLKHCHLRENSSSPNTTTQHPKNRIH